MRAWGNRFCSETEEKTKGERKRRRIKKRSKTDEMQCKRSQNGWDQHIQAKKIPHDSESKDKWRPTLVGAGTGNFLLKGPLTLVNQRWNVYSFLNWILKKILSLNEIRRNTKFPSKIKKKKRIQFKTQVIKDQQTSKQNLSWSFQWYLRVEIKGSSTPSK